MVSSAMLRTRLRRRVLFHLAMLCVCATMTVPFLWMLSSSLKASYDVFKVPIVWIPRPPVWENYINIFKDQPLLRFIGNSVKITSFVLLGQLVIASLSAYAFARVPFPGRNRIFMVYMGTLMIPGQVVILPMYLLLNKIGWLNTHWSLMIPGLFSAYGVFLLRQFFMTIPIELDESAEIDGCNPFQSYLHVMLPQIKPALATLAVFIFMGVWNDFMEPLIFLSDTNKFTLTLGLSFFKGTYRSQWNFIMTGSVISVIPIVVIYVFAQKYFVEGITMTGIKG